jgi:superfamily II DNA/RNA helicase
MTNFLNMDLPSELIDALAKINIASPTEIQSKAIPVVMEGKDIIASSQTGSGKTMAFLLPAVTKVMRTGAKVLILAPTRELAVQVSAALDKITRKIGVSGTYIIGGEPFQRQLPRIKANPDIIIGTPGRVIDHLNQGTLKLGDFNYLVLDEMDRMLDMGMKEQLDEIIGHMPSSRQMLMFSATMPKHIIALSNKYLKDPVRISIGLAHSAAPEIQQEFIEISEDGKLAALTSHLEEKEGTVIVFTKTKRGADKLARNLVRAGQSAEAIHGDLNQGRRTRVIASFRRGKTRVLVATDVAARGLDIDHVMYVFNYDLPTCPEDYLHRIGRTGRAGAKGFAVSFVTREDRSKLSAINRLINKGESDENRGRSGPSANKGRNVRSFKGNNNNSSSRRPSAGKTGFFAKKGSRPGFKGSKEAA